MKNKKTIQNINTAKNWFFEKINKIDNPLSRVTKDKREKAHMNKIRNERKVITDITDTQRIILEYYERLYDTKFNSLEEMDKFLEIYNLARLKNEQ